MRDLGIGAFGWDEDPARVDRPELLLHAAATAQVVLNPGRWYHGPAFDAAREQTGRFTGPGEALAWLERERPVLDGLLQVAAERSRPDLVWQLVEAQWSRYVHLPDLDACQADHTLGLNAACSIGDTRAQARMLEGRAWAKLHFDPEGTIADSRDAGVLELGHLHWAGAASCLQLTGMARLALGHPADAILAYEQALVLHRDEADRPRGVAVCHRLIGEALTAAGHHAAALRHLHDALDFFDHHNDEQQGQAATRLPLATTLTRLGWYDDADHTLTTTLVLARQIDAPKIEADAHDALADLARARGDHVAEHRHRERSFETWIALGERLNAATDGMRMPMGPA